MTNDVIEQLVIVFASSDDVGKLTGSLRANGFFFTRVDSRGGFLLEEVTSLLIGIQISQMENLIKIITESCPRRRKFVSAQSENSFLVGQPLVMETEAGGASLFVLDVERFIKF